MYYTGIDLHKKTSFLTTVNEEGKVVKRANLINDEALILDYFAALDEPTKVVMESTGSWYWLYDLLDGNGFEVVLSNPTKTKAIASAKIKNDKLDSHMLAQLLRTDLISTVYVPSIDTRKLKELLRHRARLVRDTVRRCPPDHWTGQTGFKVQCWRGKVILINHFLYASWRCLT